MSGSQRDTYLEFDKMLRIKKRSEFGLEFRTTAEDGIIFYIADNRHTDFIGLFMQDGHVCFMYMYKKIVAVKADFSFNRLCMVSTVAPALRTSKQRSSSMTGSGISPSLAGRATRANSMWTATPRARPTPSDRPRTLKWAHYFILEVSKMMFLEPMKCSAIFW